MISLKIMISKNQELETQKWGPTITNDIWDQAASMRDGDIESSRTKRTKETSKSVLTAQEWERNRNKTTSFSSFTLAWFFIAFHLKRNLVETISRSYVLKDCKLNFFWS